MNCLSYFALAEQVREFVARLTRGKGVKAARSTWMAEHFAFVLADEQKRLKDPGVTLLADEDAGRLYLAG